MKKTNVFLKVVICLLICIVLYIGGSYPAYLLAYIFCFLILFLKTVFSDAAVKQKIGGIMILTVILAAQIMIVVLVIRQLIENAQTSQMGRLTGVGLIFIPFLFSNTLLCKQHTDNQQ